MTKDLDDLEKKLAQFHSGKKTQTENADENGYNENLNNGMRAGVELVSSIAAGAFIGWALDKGFDTQPLFLIVFLLAGIGVGFMNVYKITQNIGSSVGFAPLHKNKKQGKNAADEKKVQDEANDEEN